MRLNQALRDRLRYGMGQIDDVGQSLNTGGIPGAGIAAEGGTETTILVGSNKYHVHLFNSSDTLTLKPTYGSIQDVEYLVVAGGGGSTSAGNNGGGGGGAGGYRSSVTGENSGGGASAESKTLVTGSVTVTVGAGGGR